MVSTADHTQHGKNKAGQHAPPAAPVASAPAAPAVAPPAAPTATSGAEPAARVLTQEEKAALFIAYDKAEAARKTVEGAMEASLAEATKRAKTTESVMKAEALVAEAREKLRTALDAAVAEAAAKELAVVDAAELAVRAAVKAIIEGIGYRKAGYKRRDGRILVIRTSTRGKYAGQPFLVVKEDDRAPEAID